MTHSTANSQQFGLFGLDVHKKTIVIAQAPVSGQAKFVQTISNQSQMVEDFFAPRVQKYEQVHAVYEAGGGGYVLARQLEKMGIKTLVVAPSKILKAPGKKVKNDKKDAENLARLLKNQVLLGQKELHEVIPPDPQDEIIREKVRQRDAFKREAKRLQNQIMAMLLRHGFHYNLTKTTWTKTYRSWLERLDFGNEKLQVIFLGYLNFLNQVEEQVEACDLELKTLCADWNDQQFIAQALQCFRGISFLSSVTIVAEIGRFSRFQSAPLLMGYIGLTPSEYSSGDSVIRGRISKTGNKRIRTLAVEAACSAYRIPKSLKTFRASCPKGVPEQVIQMAYKAQIRLHNRYCHLIHKGKSTQVARIAVARELLGFLWAAGVFMEAHLNAKRQTQVA